MNKTITKLTIIIAAAMLMSSTVHAAGVAINETGDQPAASAMLDVQNSAKGFLPPRMTAAQKLAISAPATGLMIYQTDGTTGLYVYDGSAWKGVDAGTAAIASGGTGTTTGSITGTSALTFAAGGTNQSVTLTPSGTGYTLLGGNVGIGTATPGAKLDVRGVASAFNLALNLYYDGSWRQTTTGYGGYLNIDNPTGNIYLLNTGSSVSAGVATTPTIKLTIAPSGNVGIGTTTPGYMLDVTGTARVAGVFYLGNATAGQAYFDGGYSAKIDASGVGHGQDLRFHTGSAGAVERMRITSSGNVGIGTAAPAYKLHVTGGTIRNDLGSNGVSLGLTGGGSNLQIYHNAGSSVYFWNSASGIYEFYNAGGSTSTGTLVAGAYNIGSDSRLKNNIVNTHFGVSDLMKIQVRDYTYKADAANTLTTGFIAQELYDIFPNAVTKPANAEDMWSVDYGKVTPLLVKGMQDLKAENEALKSENEEIRKELAVIKKVLGL